MNQITYPDFSKVDIRVGRVIDAQDSPKAKKPAYKLRIDFGPLGIKQSSAQITTFYKKEDLLNKLILAVVNFPPKQIADFQSEVLVLGALDAENQVILVHPERDVPLGAKIA